MNDVPADTSEGMPSGQAGGRPSEARAGPVRRFLVPVLAILLVVVVSVVLYVYRHEIEGLKQYAYLGVFLISLLSNATVILPVPGVLVFVPLLATLNPVIVGVVGAAGGIMGEVTGYVAGYGGGSLAKRGRLYQRVAGWMKKRGTLVVFLFSVVPVLPLDVAGVVAGAVRFPLWKFLTVAWVGKTIKYVGLMLLAAWGLEWLLRFLALG